MPKRRPVRSNRLLLPFVDRDFSWEVFEEFFCAFLAAQPTIEVLHRGERIVRRVRSVRLYGRRGDDQKGIDLRAEVEGGPTEEIWVFQCRHYTKWAAGKTAKAISECEYTEASHKFLLVTCSVGEDSRAVVEKELSWTLWDGGEITQQFLRLKPESEAAAILYRCFGPGWDTKFFKVSGIGPLLTPDAFFKPWRRAARDFHHNLPLIGRTERFRELDAFVKQRVKRVLLFTGRGGVGKSRLLAAWSERFSRRHRGIVLRFASRKGDDFEPHLRASGDRTVVVLDDAHQESSLRQRLFESAVRLDDVQLVLALRPGPNEAVRQELISAGYDTTDITELTPLSRLGDEDALKLAMQALGPTHSDYAPLLYEASRDCPLIAVVGGALIRKGEVHLGNLSAHQDIRSAVFERLGKQAELATSDGFALRDIQEFLAIVSLLSPIANDESFRQRAAEFLGNEWREHRIAALVQALERHGVLLSGSSGLRITPDLYSDHVAYRACYDGHGKATGFADAIIKKFGDQAFVAAARHLAEAEWRAHEEHEQPESIVAPIVELFHTQYLNGSFYQRATLLDRWNQIAVLRPLETLDIVKLARRDTEARPDEDVRRFGGETALAMDSFANVLDRVPSLLRSVGAHHQAHVVAALETLWQLARERSDDQSQNENHPLSAMAAIGGYERWKPPEICAAALGWTDSFFSTEEWLHAKPSPSALLQVLLKPFLGVWVDASFWTRRTCHMRYLPVRLDAVREFRDTVLQICRRILARGAPTLSLAVLRIADEAASPLRPPAGGDTTPELESVWLPERRKALLLFGEILKSTSHLAVQFAVRRELLQYQRQARREAVEFLADVEALLLLVGDTLDMRTMRVLFSSSHEEFAEPYSPHVHDFSSHHECEKERWRLFIASVAEEIANVQETAEQIAGYIDRITVESAGVGWDYPEIRRLAAAIAEVRPDLGIALVEYMLAHPEHQLANSFDLLVLKCTASDGVARLHFIHRALTSVAAGLRTKAVYGLSWWRREEELPADAWDLIANVEMTSKETICAMVVFVDDHTAHATTRDLEILDRIPLAEEQPKIVAQVIDAIGDIAARQQTLGRPAAARILHKLIGFYNLEEDRIHNELSQLAQHAPAEVFDFFVDRYVAAKEGRYGEGYKAIPRWAVGLPIFGLSSSPHYRPTVERLWKAMLSADHTDYCLDGLLRAALLTGNTHPEPLLNELLEFVDTGEELERLINFVTMSSLVLAYPLWAKRLLIRSRQFGSARYERARQGLWMSCDSGSGSENGEPNAQTRYHLEALKKLAKKYETDDELGSLFASATASYSRRIERDRREFLCELSDE